MKTFEGDPLFGEDGYAFGLAFDHAGRLPLKRPLPALLSTVFSPEDGIAAARPNFGLGDETIVFDPEIASLFERVSDSTQRVLSLTVPDPHNPARTIPSEIATCELAINEGMRYVAVQAHTGGEFEDDMFAFLADIAGRGLPTLAMIYPRVEDGHGSVRSFTDTDSVAYGVEKASRIRGVTAIKAPGCDAFEQVVVAANGVPVLLAGGEKRRLQTVVYDVGSALDVGARGAVIGRGILQADNPRRATTALNRVIHKCA